jgi:YVTN family beta-propeller protein
MHKLWIKIIAFIFIIVFITTFNYGGCGGGGSSGSSSSSGTFLIYTDPSTNVTSNSATLHGRVNPGGRSTTVYFKYGTNSECSNATYPSTAIGAGTTTVNVSYDLTGLLPHALYYFKVAATRGGVTIYGTANQTFTTKPPTPTCTTNPATNITTDSARLNGTVNPNWAATNAYFEYGITSTPPSYTITTTAYAIGSGSSDVPVTADITAGLLLLNTEYNFRVFGTNSTGTSYGNNLTFITGNSHGSAPTCITDPASNVVTDSAKLNGTVIPNEVDTDAYFEYGITTTPITYPISTTTLQPIGNGITSVALSATVSSLTPNTLYNFRVVGTNGPITTTYGNNLTFTTAARPPATDDYVWVANGNSANVTRIQKSNLTTTTIAVGNGPYGIAVDETYCWVANGGSANVTRIKKSDSTTTNITVGTQSKGVAVDETYCWVANSTSPGTVTRILKADSTTTTIAVGNGPFGVAVDETYCWVANYYSGSVTRILKSNSTTTTIPVGTEPEGVAVDDTYCWVANSGGGSGNTVTRIKKSDSTTTTIPVGTQPEGVAVDGTYCWVAIWGSNNVTRIQKSDLSTTMITVGITGPLGVAVDGTYCWVANNSSGANSVTRILKSDLSTTNITVGTRPYSLGDMTGYAFDNYSWVP